MAAPLVSIIIPLYNKEDVIKEALNTVLAQTFSDYECIIINDGSTDNSLKVAYSIKDSRFKVITQPNGGVSRARNRGIKEARGEYITFLDADDLWKPDFLETLLSLRKRYPHCSVFGSAVSILSLEGKSQDPVQRNFTFETSGELNNYFEVASSSFPPLHSSAILVHKDALNSIGGFPVGVKSGEDLLTWAKLAVHNKIAYTRNPLAYYRFSIKPAIQKESFRLPDENDYVGRELKRLFHENQNIKGLKDYVALWHKMRAHAFLAAGNNKKARNDLLKMFRYKISIKGVIMLLLSFSPTFVSKMVLKV